MRLIPFGKTDGGNLNFQTVGLPAAVALEMNMIVMMSAGCTGFVAERVLQTPGVVEHFMNEASVQKSFEGAVNRDAVKVIVDGFFNVSVRQGVFTL